MKKQRKLYVTNVGSSLSEGDPKDAVKEVYAMAHYKYNENALLTFLRYAWIHTPNLFLYAMSNIHGKPSADGMDIKDIYTMTTNKKGQRVMDYIDLQDDYRQVADWLGEKRSAREKDEHYTTLFNQLFGDRSYLYLPKMSKKILAGILKAEEEDKNVNMITALESTVDTFDEYFQMLTEKSGGKFAVLVKKLMGKGHSKKSATKIAAYIGRKKYGKANFAKMAASGRKG